MAYVRLSGKNAFGWQRDGMAALGKLTAGKEYVILHEAGETRFKADPAGAWRGKTGEIALVMDAKTGEAVLYNEARLTADAAYLLAKAQRQADKKEKEPIAQAVVKAKSQTKTEAETEDAPPVVYREQGQGAAVDRLPSLVWPEKFADLKAVFAENAPLRLFDAPGWRFVRVREGNMVCCFGCCAENDCVTQALYGVQARGGIVPKGLRGYRYERALDGSAYWTLRQRI